jgi:hypothetical protein
MSEPGWAPPGGQPTPDPSGWPAPAPAFEHENWGLAGYALPGSVVLVPRPPRPSVLSTAIYLAFAGAALSGVQTIASTLYLWRSPERIAGTNAANVPQGYNTAVAIGLVVGVGLWLVPAAGTVVCAAFTWRGSNAARIVLACLMGVFALNEVCGATAALVLQSVSTDQGSGVFNTSLSTPWWSAVVQAVLGVLTVTIGVLLLLPSANRYLSAGPGRRFTKTS